MDHWGYTSNLSNFNKMTQGTIKKCQMFFGFEHNIRHKRDLCEDIRLQVRELSLWDSMSHNGRFSTKANWLLHLGFLNYMQGGCAACITSVSIYLEFHEPWDYVITCLIKWIWPVMLQCRVELVVGHGSLQGCWLMVFVARAMWPHPLCTIALVCLHQPLAIITLFVVWPWGGA